MECVLHGEDEKWTIEQDHNAPFTVTSSEHNGGTYILCNWGINFSALVHPRQKKKWGTQFKLLQKKRGREYVQVRSILLPYHKNIK